MASPWSKNAPSSPVTFPPPLATSTPSPPPPLSGIPTRPRRRWPWAVAAMFIVVALSAGIGSAVTYLATRSDRGASLPPSAPSSTPPTPQFSATESGAAKKNLCQVFDASVRGQEGQGGLRVGGQLNIPAVLRSLNSATAVQNAIVPALPEDVASAAKKYISTTLDQTTAAMGNASTSEGNRLTDIRNEATYSLLDTCGLPR